MRKRQFRWDQPVHHRRFTRTHAEKTFGISSTKSPAAIYPHTCGKDRTDSIFGSTEFDLPAHMRKRRMGGRLQAAEDRFTRTHAEKTPAFGGLHIPAPIYPHTCGKDSKASILKNCDNDLPAHMRKRLQGVHLEELRQRFTRTHAEKTAMGSAVPGA